MQGILVYSASAIIQTLNYLKLDYPNDLKWIILIYTGCPQKNDPTLQCHIFKNIEFDVFKFSTVI